MRVNLECVHGRMVRGCRSFIQCLTWLAAALLVDFYIGIEAENLPFPFQAELRKAPGSGRVTVR